MRRETERLQDILDAIAAIEQNNLPPLKVTVESILQELG